MPSNADYTKQATELAEELGLGITTDGLNNAKLGDLVSDLRAKKKDAETHTQADGAEAGELSVAETEEAKPHPYSVAEGKSITSKKGVLAPGDEIKADYLGGGQKSLDILVKSNFVVEA